MIKKSVNYRPFLDIYQKDQWSIWIEKVTTCNNYDSLVRDSKLKFLSLFRHKIYFSGPP